ncbi:pyridoxamine 5'-phosphate oxidase family protein [Kovacikia minuta CCNUW1]|uniref:Npun_F5749 family FMN-dependent PPOX-type flavoprotein n=1 Tax=Kovacikia minuta TaxID=2931930 RepID=UPI001CCB8B20|nr:Npun_F5749 family FMN-dependent PPOX-type flavoprotein [Kovacikia minuta]UBF28296.1 pyridoxamine 5'-phosphate oxidase family protein [Kovacikia minuta CCNUW1]
MSSWRSSLARALHRNRSLPNSRYLQLATVRADGRPANRTVVFRGFLEATEQLKFVTDARSEKVDQMCHSPWAEVCWYFPKTREQFRISGSLILVEATCEDTALQKARNILWQELSDAARSQFTWADPGKPRAGVEGFNQSPPDGVVPLPHFCLLLLQPDRVDHLELRGNPQNRWIYAKTDQTWSVQEVNP